MKQTRHMTLQGRCQAPHKSEPEPRPERVFRSTADILARGVSLHQVLQAVKRLRPHIDRVS